MLDLQNNQDIFFFFLMYTKCKIPFINGIKIRSDAQLCQEMNFSAYCTCKLFVADVIKIKFSMTTSFHTSNTFLARVSLFLLSQIIVQILLILKFPFINETLNEILRFVLLILVKIQGHLIR